MIGPIKVNGLSLPLSEKTKGKEITLLEYQKQALERTEKIIILKAPTGGGKTLAASLIAYETGGIALFAYPTNALAMDQLNSMANTLTKCGINVAVLNSKTGSFSKFSGKNPEVVLALATSSSLDSLANVFGIKSHGQALLKLRKELLPEKANLFLLTNPDFLFVLLKGIPRLVRYKTLFVHLVSSIRTLVIDEFHLYYGFTLANVLNLIHILHRSLNKIVISSATLGPVELLKEGYPGEVAIIEAIPGEGRQVRYPINLKITSLKATGPLWGERAINAITKLAREALDEVYQEEADVKVLVLVNSVIFAEKLYNKLKSNLDANIQRIHGFIPDEKRNYDADILIGTRAIDIGIDFDASTVIFEALSASDFVQRLGRGARKRPGYAIAILPGDYTNRMGRLIDSKQRFEYLQLIEIIRQSLPEDRRYWDFVRKEVGALSLFSILCSLFSSIEGKKGVESNVLFKTAEILDKEKWLKPRWLAVNPVDVVKAAGRKIDNRVVSSVAKSGMRGDILTVKAFFEEFNTWGEVGITELWKLDFEVSLNAEEPYIIIHKISEEGSQPKLWMDTIPESPRIFKKGRVYFDSRNQTLIKLEEEITKLLEDKLVKVTSKVEDWRFPTFPFKLGKGLCAVIGPDAIIQYLLERKSIV